MKRNLLATTAAAAAIMFSQQVSADQVFLDDLIVDGSICAGMDCVNGESFGFDTIRLKENNLRIKFEDTSTTSSFPGRDWQITVNDSANGGLNKFSIEDIDGGRTPFTIEGNAPSHSLYVDDGGRLGLGTSTPVVDIHSKSGNTPTLRLEQDGSSGFTPQAWDVAGNETNFFIRDATNGSTLPFRIRPGAPTSSIDIAANGRIGVSDQSPDDAIHITNVKDATNRYIGLRYEDTGTSINWRTIFDTTDDRFLITKSSSGGAELIIDNTGDVTIRGGLITGSAGSCTTAAPCDLVFDSAYKVPSIEEHAKEMWKNKYLPTVGQTSAGEPINVTQKVTRMLNELEKAHIYIEQLHERLSMLENSALRDKTAPHQ